jgi:hypothetical protein
VDEIINMNSKTDDRNFNEPNKLESSSLLQGQSQSQSRKKQEQHEIALPEVGSVVSVTGEKFTLNHLTADVKGSISSMRVLPKDRMGRSDLPEKIVMAKHLELLLSFLYNQSFLNLYILLLSKTLLVKVHRIKEIEFQY